MPDQPREKETVGITRTVSADGTVKVSKPSWRTKRWITVPTLLWAAGLVTYMVTDAGKDLAAMQRDVIVVLLGLILGIVGVYTGVSSWTDNRLLDAVKK